MKRTKEHNRKIALAQPNRKEIPTAILHQKYVEEGKSTRQVATELTTTQTHVRRWMLRHGIKSRTRSNVLKANWAKDEYVRMQMTARNRTTQNKQEKIVERLLDELFPSRYKFVGDGSVIIASKCPDFIDEQSKSIVEFVGSYWHDKEEEQLKIEHYAKHGYSCIIIWDYELLDITQLNSKLQLCNNQNNQLVTEMICQN